MPEEASDSDEETPEYRLRNKKALFEWILEADFTEEMQLHKVADHRFKLEEDEENAMIDINGVLKICKVLMYKIGLTYKRMDIYFSDLRKEFKTDTDAALGGMRKDLSYVNEMIQQVHDEVE